MMPYVAIGLEPSVHYAEGPRLAGDGRGPSPKGGLTEQARQMQGKVGGTEACDGFQACAMPIGDTP